MLGAHLLPRTARPYTVSRTRACACRAPLSHPFYSLAPDASRSSSSILLRRSRRSTEGDLCEDGNFAAMLEKMAQFQSQELLAYISSCIALYPLIAVQLPCTLGFS